MGNGEWGMGNGEWGMERCGKSNPSFILSVWGPSSGLMSIYNILLPSLFSGFVKQLFQGKGRSLATYLHPYPHTCCLKLQ